MKLLAQKHIAKLAGVSAAAVNQAIKVGKLAGHKNKRGFNEVDLDAPETLAWINTARANSLKERAAKGLIKPSARDENDIDAGEANRLKTLETTALTRIKKAQEALKYAQSLEAVIDAETFRRKMGLFVDFLTTRLIYLPEDCASTLWQAAKASDDPEGMIRDELTVSIAAVVKEAKRVAAEIEPPPAGRTYVILDDDIDKDQA